mmetsp:Transcript_44087/g.95631  ORF Transcript_44087/g.95631 Transcript_44087/m.95631 type:complete len:346 (-) Transcript_44087:33-1070(-)
MVASENTALLVTTSKDALPAPGSGRANNLRSLGFVLLIAVVALCAGVAAVSSVGDGRPAVLSQDVASEVAALKAEVSKLKEHQKTLKQAASDEAKKVVHDLEHGVMAHLKLDIGKAVQRELHGAKATKHAVPVVHSLAVHSKAVHTQAVHAKAKIAHKVKKARTSTRSVKSTKPTAAALATVTQTKKALAKTKKEAMATTKKEAAVKRVNDKAMNKAAKELAKARSLMVLAKKHPNQVLKQEEGTKTKAKAKTKTNRMKKAAAELRKARSMLAKLHNGAGLGSDDDDASPGLDSSVSSSFLDGDKDSSDDPLASLSSTHKQALAQKFRLASKNCAPMSKWSVSFC